MSGVNDTQESDPRETPRETPVPHEEIDKNDRFRTTVRSLDLSGLDTSSLEELGKCFKGCTSLESVYIVGF